MAHRINTGRQAIASLQRNCNYRPNNNIAAHVLSSTVTGKGLSGQVISRVAGRTFTVNGLRIAKGERVTLVASRFPNRYYVRANGQWSTNDAAVIVKCQQALQDVKQVATYRKDGKTYEVTKVGSTLVEVQVGDVTIVTSEDNLENAIGWNEWRMQMVGLMHTA